jgi:hypothetical protein
MNERQAYIEKMKAKLDEWNADIDKFEAQTKSAGADAQIRFQQQLDELKATRDAAAKQLRELQDASADAWETMRQGAEAAWEEMVKASRDATNRFK